MDADPARARAEVADLERLSRDALVDVRRAVEGFRELTLPGELARAREALRSAGIEADLPGSAEVVPQRHARGLRVGGARGGHERHPAQRRDAVHRPADGRAGRGPATTAPGRRRARCGTTTAATGWPGCASGATAAGGDAAHQSR